MRIASVGTAFPPHRYPQAVITQHLKDRMQDTLPSPAIMDRLHANCGVEYRHMMYSLDSVGTHSGFGPSNDLWIKGALELGQQAIQNALDQAGLPGLLSMKSCMTLRTEALERFPRWRRLLYEDASASGGNSSAASMA
jgi:predicted naringenin-chalcone synthase